MMTAFSLALSSAAFAGAKTHEVTGTVLETTPTKIVIQKGRGAMGNRSRSANQGERRIKGRGEGNHRLRDERDED